MADLAYRRLERGLQDPRRLLEARVRLGLCDPERATVAEVLLQEGTDPAQLLAALNALRELSTEATLRTVLVLADAALARWLTLQPKDLTHMLVVRRMRLWVECPCRSCAWDLGDAVQARGAARIRERLARNSWRERDPDLSMAHSAAKGICTAARVLLDLDGRGLVRKSVFLSVAERALSAGCTSQGLLQDLWREVLPWLMREE